MSADDHVRSSIQRHFQQLVIFGVPAIADRMIVACETRKTALCLAFSAARPGTEGLRRRPLMKTFLSTTTRSRVSISL